MQICIYAVSLNFDIQIDEDGNSYLNDFVECLNPHYIKDNDNNFVCGSKCPHFFANDEFDASDLFQD